MKIITEITEITEALNDFAPSKDGAHATCRLIEGAESAFDPQEWAEYGTIDGAPAKVYYIFSGEEASREEADSYPWDADHVWKIELAEKDDDGDWEQL